MAKKKDKKEQLAIEPVANCDQSTEVVANCDHLDTTEADISQYEIEKLKQRKAEIEQKRKSASKEEKDKLDKELRMDAEAVQAHLQRERRHGFAGIEDGWVLQGIW